MTADQIADVLTTGYPDWVGIPNAEIVAELIAPRTTRRNTSLQTAKAIVLSFGREQSELVIGGFAAAGEVSPVMKAMYFALCSQGLDFSNEETQSAIDALIAADVWGSGGAGASAQIGAALKALGIWQVSLAQQFGGEVPTEETVAEARLILAKRALIGRVKEAYEQTLLAIAGGTVTAWAGAVTKFGEG